MKKQILVIRSDDLDIEDIKKIRVAIETDIKAGNTLTLTLIKVGVDDDIKVVEIDVPDPIPV